MQAFPTPPQIPFFVKRHCHMRFEQLCLSWSLAGGYGSNVVALERLFTVDFYVLHLIEIDCFWVMRLGASQRR